MVGQLTYNTTVDNHTFLDAVYGYAVNGSNDEKAAVIPLVQYVSLNRVPSFTSMLFYNGGGVGQIPKAVANFTPPSMAVSANTFEYCSMGNWSQELYAETKLIHSTKNRFWVLNFYADREALQIVYDTYMDALDRLNPGSGLFISGIALMPVPSSFFSASLVNGGDPQSVDTSGGTYIFVEESMTYEGNLTDAAVDNFYSSTNANITSILESRGKKISKFLYLNDANAMQPVWEDIRALV